MLFAAFRIHNALGSVVRGMGSREWKRWLLGPGALVLSAVLACGRSDPETLSRPDVLLVTFDTARADRFGAYGSEKGLTPNFDRLAEEGVLFDLAIAPTPLTLPSHASILTGVYPPAHGIQDNERYSLAEEATLLSEVFRDHGWRTGAFVGSYVLGPRYGLDQGFEVYRDPGERKGRASAERVARAVVNDALDWIATLETDTPIFLWVHFYDPHFPYDAKAGKLKKIADPYDREIASCDRQLGRLLIAVENRKHAHPLLTVVTADHGESLGEHGERTHGLLVHQSTLWVPLVISGGPVTRSRGTRIPHGVSITALAPTLLQLASLPADAMPDVLVASLLEVDGSSRVKHDEPIYFENQLPYDAHRWRAGRGLVWKHWKLIEGFPSQLYALSEDPSEQRDLVDEEPDIVREMQERLARLVDAHPSLDWRQRREVSSEERLLLESLGYWETRDGSNPYDASLPDVRDRIGDIEVLREFRALLDFAMDRADDPVANAEEERERDQRVQEILAQAAEKIAPVREQNPGSPSVARRLSRLEALRGNEAGVAKHLKEIVDWGAGARDDRFNLAVLHAKMGQVESAIEDMEILVARHPDYTSPYEWLAFHHRKVKEFDTAITWAERRLAMLETNDPQIERAERFIAETKEERDELESVAP